MLAEAMNAGEQPGQSPFSTLFVPPAPTVVMPPAQAVSQATDTAPQTEGQPTATAGAIAVPPRYAIFYQLLISKPQWDLKEIDGLARQQGLMLSGAIDALNEWAAETYGGQLCVEDGGRVLVEQAYLN